MKRTTQIVRDNSIKTSLECTYARESSAGSENVHFANSTFFISNVFTLNESKLILCTIVRV